MGKGGQRGFLQPRVVQQIPRGQPKVETKGIEPPPPAAEKEALKGITPPPPAAEKEALKGITPPPPAAEIVAVSTTPGAPPTVVGMIRVEKTYADQHPDAVKQIGDYYYRPITGTATAFLSSEERAELQKQIIAQIEAGEVAFGSLGGGNVGWSEELALQNALKILAPYGTPEGEYITYDIMAIALNGTPAVMKAARVAFPDIAIDVVRQTLLELKLNLKKTNPDLFQILTEQGYDAYKKAYDSAINALKRYEINGGYDIVTLSLSGNSVAKKAAALILPGVTMESLNTLREEFKNSTKLSDGMWMTNEDIANVKEHHPDLYEILTQEGGGAYEIAAKAQEAAMEAALAQLEKYKTENGYNILAAVKDSISRQTFEDAGFEPEVIDWAFEAKKSAEETGVALPGSNYYVSIKTREVISEAELQQRQLDFWKSKKDSVSAAAARGDYTEWETAVREAPNNEFTLSPEDAKRMFVEGMTFLFVPSKALLPEVELKDVSALDWAIGGAQIATLALPVVRSGGAAAQAVRAGISGAAGGIFTAATVVNWEDLTPAQRAMAVAVDILVLLPALNFILKPRISSVKIPTTTGEEVPVWTGLSIRGRPVIGRSGGQLVLGTGDIKYPQLTEIKLGGAEGPTYEPGVSKIEANIMASQRAMEKMDFSEAEILKVQETLARARGFKGSPFLEGESPPPSFQSLNGQSVAVVFKEAAALGKKLDRIYGSSSLEPQLQAEILKYWHETLGRMPADIDISVFMTAEEMEQYIRNTLLPKLRVTEGAGNVRISSQSPALIEIRGPDGNWHHAVDIHSPIEPGAYGSEAAGEGAYGFEFARPAVKVNYNIGNTQYELRLMRIDETGLRKMQSILWWRRTGGKGAPPEVQVTPAAHRAKDVADFYIITWNLQGKAAADKWAAAYGFTTQAQLDGLLETAMADPPRFSGWEWSPSASGAAASSGTAPTIQIMLPPSLAASLKSESPSLYRSITSPISPSAPASVSMGSSVTISPSLKPSTQPSDNVSGVLVKSSAASAVSGKLSSKPSGRPSVSSSSSTSAASAVSGKPSSKPSGRPSVSSSPSTSPSSSAPPSPSPSPSPSPKTSPFPLPYPYPYPSLHPSPSTPVKIVGHEVTTKRKRQEFAGAICWRQGALGRRNPKDVWYAIKAPYSRQEDVGIFIGEPPLNAQIVEGGAESAYRSIQSITGNAPEKLKIDLGIQDIVVQSPTKKPGKPGAIAYRRDVEQATTGDITIGPRRPKVTKGTVTESLETAPPLGSTKMPAAVAAAIGSYKGRITPEGKVVVKVRRL